jgi:hypothetical protein
MFVISPHAVVFVAVACIAILGVFTIGVLLLLVAGRHHDRRCRHRRL